MNKPVAYLFTIIITIVTFTVLAGTGNEPEPYTGNKLSQTQTLETGEQISLETAKAIALAKHGGRILEIEKEREHGRQVFEVKGVNETGHQYKIYLDAIDGAPLKSDYD